MVSRRSELKMKQRVIDLLYDMASREGFYYLDMKRFCEDNQEQIKRQIKALFSDFGDEKIFYTAQYLIAKTFEGFDEIEKPEYFDEYKKFVLGAFIQDMSFFSSCWNYMVLEKNQVGISNSTNKQVIKNINRFDTNWSVLIPAAGRPGFNNITDRDFADIGKIQIRANEITKEILFVVFLKDEFKSSKIEFTVEFKSRGGIKVVTFEKDNSEKLRVLSNPISVDYEEGKPFEIEVISLSYRIL